jgi:ribosomal protein S18 acetylase RimI-like enzyme
VKLAAERGDRSDADGCLALLHAASVAGLGSVGWRDPRVAGIVAADAAARRLYVVRDGSAGGARIATFALCGEIDDYLLPVEWAEPGARAAYLHRLAVHTAQQGSGIGTWCVRTVERLAEEQGAAYLRLDALQDDPRALRFYARLGYEARGIVWRPTGDAARPLVALVGLERRLAGRFK